MTHPVRFLWIAGLAFGVLLLQAGCQQAGTPEGEQEAAAPEVSPPAQTSRPAPSQAAAPPAARAPATPAAASQPRSVTVPAGTPLKVRTKNTLSTNLQQTGDAFTVTLEEPLMAGGSVIAARGSALEGRVVEADKGGRVKGVSRLVLALNRLHAEGQTVEIATTNVTVEADTTKTKDAAKVGIGAAVGTAIGAIAGGKKGAAVGAATGAGAGTAVVLSTRGDAAEIASETVLSFELASPVMLR